MNPNIARTPKERTPCPVNRRMRTCRRGRHIAREARAIAGRAEMWLDERDREVPEPRMGIRGTQRHPHLGWEDHGMSEALRHEAP